MENYLLLPKSEELEKQSKVLGYSKTHFNEDSIIITADTKKDLLKQINPKKQTFFRPKTEEMLRFALERTKITGIVGAEQIHPKNSMHYVRSGLDQITCKIAKNKGKIILFAFEDIKNSKNQGKLLARMKLNKKLCKKYKVKTAFTTLTKSPKTLPTAKDLQIFWNTLDKPF